MNLELNNMVVSDLDSISNILESEFDDFWNYNVFKQELENENSIYIVAKINNEIVGFGGIWNSVDDVHITNIVTKKNMRNLGIATQILTKLINIANSLKFTSVTLEVNENNTNAIKLYEKFNFTKSFIGANGIHPLHGFTTVDTDEAMLKKEAVNHSYVSYVLADHTKFGKVTAVTFAPLEKACIVTDGIVKDKYKELTLIKEVHVE